MILQKSNSWNFTAYPVKFSLFIKMNIKYLKYINTLFVVFPMTLLMAFVGIIRNYGFHEGWLGKMFHAWVIMFPVAYLAAFFIIPFARFLTEKVISKR